uniref:Chloroplast unusual positioning 1B n=1 Tax=Adiantum capillus-veneris TaxID=13818 RepID=B3IYT8_ADICA|nr:chloroplast unusual positioning 1B [Adiantum capillus-veneris]
MFVVRVVLAVALSFVAVTFAQRKDNHSRDHRSAEPVEEDSGDGKEIYTYADACANSKEKEEEEVKCVSACSPTLSCKSYQENDQLLLPEFDDLFNGGMNFPSDSEKSRLKYDSDDSVESKRYESNSEDDEALEIFEALTASSKQRPQPANEDSNRSASFGPDSSTELAQLKAIVEDLQGKEMKLEAELLEYYGLKEQEKNHLELEKQLRRKNVEIDKLHSKLACLEEQAKVLSEELKGKNSMTKELEAAHTKIKDLQKTLHSDTSQTKAQLLMLKQHVAILQEREQEATKRDFNTEQKLQTLKELEVEVMELRRTIKDLQHQKRELTVKLNVAEAKIAELSNRTESDKVAEMQAQASTLRQANEDLSKQVEGLQMNRFSEVEELVYLRWVNACLRYELRNFKAPPGKTTALDLGKSLSPKSQEKAKQLMMEYAGPDLLATKSREHSEQDYDSISSFPSTPSEGDLEDSSLDGNWTGHSSTKKLGLFKKLKKWGRSKEENQISPASSSSDLRSSPAPGHRRTRSKGSLETLMLRNSSDSVAITTFGTNEFEVALSSTSTDSSEPLGEPRLTRSRSSSGVHDVSSNVAASFDLMSKSVSGVLDEKYPAFKERHKLAIARETALKDKAEKARVEKLVEKLKPVGAPATKREKAAPGKLNPHMLVQAGRETISATEHNPVRTVVNKMKLSEVQKRAPRVPKPAPKSSINGSSTISTQASLGGVSAGPPLPPPPPPPPPPRAPGAPPPPPLPGSLKVQGTGKEQVQRAPEVVEFYQSLMRREAKKDTSLGASDVNASDARNNMIGEIENRSAFLLAVKADVETQGDFVQSLATEVREAAYTDIEDVIAFVAWLDEELSFLVDERAVLKHFDWPESKADALREAAFEYQDLKKLETEVSSFEDDPGLSCELSLKKMLSLLEKVELSVFALLRSRDMAIARYKEYNVPTQWMLDSGLVGKIKLATVQLARKYMKRVALELDSTEVVSSVKEPQREFLLLQGVRFAFRVHQFAGGFDAESMCAFEELRDRVRAQTTGD